MPSTPVSTEQVTVAMHRWIERAVIGLNLCPFAKAVQVRGQVHLAVCESPEFRAVLEALNVEIDALLETDAAVRDTTLLVVPAGFDEFLLFLELVHEGERLLARRRLNGVLQLASFHPGYVFSGAEDDDPANWSNRAPYPVLHLLRETSIDRAVAAFPDARAIFESNVTRLRQLGQHGWAALDVGPA